jgi:hypothetical protein
MPPPVNPASRSHRISLYGGLAAHQGPTIAPWEAAAVSGIPERTIRRWCQAGTVPGLARKTDTATWAIDHAVLLLLSGIRMESGGTMPIRMLARETVRWHRMCAGLLFMLDPPPTAEGTAELKRIAARIRAANPREKIPRIRPPDAVPSSREVRHVSE